MITCNHIDTINGRNRFVFNVKVKKIASALFNIIQLHTIIISTILIELYLNAVSYRDIIILMRVKKYAQFEIFCCHMVFFMKSLDIVVKMAPQFISLPSQCLFDVNCVR